MLSLLAVSLAFVGVWLLFAPGQLHTPPIWVLALPALLLVPSHPAWVALAGLALGAVVLLRRVGARRQRTQEINRRLAAATTTLISELRSGRTVVAALEVACEDLPALAPAHAAAQLGGDVPDALRALSTRPGLSDLRLVAASWQVAERHGAGLAGALTRLGTELAARRASQRLVSSELASARATAQLVAGLPVFVWLIGSGSGSHPVSFLLGGPSGWVCLAGGVGLIAVGLLWLEAISQGVTR